MRTLRNRKDELILNLKDAYNQVVPPYVPEINNPGAEDDQLYKHYKNIFTTNGITNPKLLKGQLDRIVKMIRENNINGSSASSAIYSNLKFINLLRSRLTEEGISFEHAEQIITYTDFDLSEITEDDDFVGDVALRYAELVKKHYDVKVVPGTLELSDGLAKNLNPYVIRIPS